MKGKYFSIFLNSLLLIIFGVIITKIVYSEAPIARAQLEFTLEVTDGIVVEPVYLDFGNILKNSEIRYEAESFFNLEGNFVEDMLVTTSYSEGTIEGDCTKVEVFKSGETQTDKLDVYLYNLKDRILQSGETKIPVRGEIRRVGDIGIGKYEKSVNMNVVITPISPSSRLGGEI